MLDSHEAEADSILDGARRRDSALVATINSIGGSSLRHCANVARSARVSNVLTQVLAR
ncbi:MAG: hypothetical protein SGI84_08610 [Gemmatimonadota bacterium]|nr:hypothetical protein [Gemmatimonadota bacterium]